MFPTFVQDAVEPAYRNLNNLLEVYVADSGAAAAGAAAAGGGGASGGTAFVNAAAGGCAAAAGGGADSSPDALSSAATQFRAVFVGSPSIPVNVRNKI